MKRRRAKRKSDRSYGEDRLSSLPDGVLVDILRLVPFELAAATSILSKRWRNLWTEHTYILISFYYIRKRIYHLGSNFSNKIDLQDLVLSEHVLNSSSTVSLILERLTSPTLRTFDLYFSYYALRSEREHDAMSSCLEPWLGRICGRNIEAIKLSIGDQPTPNVFIWLPFCIFQTQSLVKLVLQNANYNCEMPRNVTLPNLKYLEMKLGNLEEFHRQLLATLSESCPLLQNLCLHFNWIDDANSIHLSSHSLKCLSIKIWHMLTCFEGTRPCKFLIDAPNLDYINISGQFRGSFEFTNKPTKLAKADIDIYNDYHGEMLGLFQGISCARSLALVDGYDRVIESLNFWEERGRLPLFSDLNELHIELDSLESLGWHEQFPALMLTKVKKIKLEYYEGIKDSMKFMKWILSNSFVLELLSVSVTYLFEEDRYEQEKRFCEALFMLERSSKICQIQFTGDCFSASSSTFKSNLASETAI